MVSSPMKRGMFIYPSPSLAFSSTSTISSLTPKASRIMGRKPFPPGQHGRRQHLGRVRMSDYKRQLMEKQKLSAQYNVTEQQLRNYFQKAISRAQRTPDITSVDILVQLLET